MKKLYFILFTTLVQMTFCTEVQVQTPAGKISGLLAEDRSHKIFKGIRYGKYQKRFAVSEVEDNLVSNNKEGIYYAHSFGASCPQSNRINLAGPLSEDCLFLNIWTPLETQETAQVMVFIHGGGYVQGSGNDLYVDGKAYTAKNKILVSVNYRLGLFGFFAHSELTAEDSENPTNVGILDVVTALHWIKKYISFFGGNPNDLTVFGESAGASVIMWLLAHKDHATNPLFTRAIIQSPPAASFPYDLHEASDLGVGFATQIGCPPPNALACLRAKPVEDLLAIQWDRKGLPSLSYVPVPNSPSRIATPHVDYKNFPVHPAIGGINGDANTHKIIIGTTKDEWTLFLWLQHMFLLPSDEWMNRAIDLIFTSPHFVNQPIPKLGLSERLENLYPRNDYESGFYRVSAIYTDMLFYCPTRNYARRLAGQGATTNFYLFSHEPIHGNKLLRSNHASELPFVFQKSFPSFYRGQVKVFPDDFEKEEVALSSLIIDLWTQLGKQDKLQINENFQWPDYTAEGENILNISLFSDIIPGQFLAEKCEFWNEITTVPQRQIEFDILAHEPFVLKLINEYTIDLAMILIKNRTITIFASTLLSISFCYCVFCACCRNSRKNKRE